MARALALSVHEGCYAVCRFDPGDAPPAVPDAAAFFSVIRTRDEMSVVCRQEAVPSGARSEGGWRLLQVEEDLDFGAVGILSDLTSTLAAAEVPLFAFSTFDTDYLLVREADLSRATRALRRGGHEVDRKLQGRSSDV